MTLVVKAGPHRNLGKIAAGANQALRQRDASLQDVRVRRQSELATERADQLIAAQAGFLGKLAQRQRCRGIGIDPLSCTSDARDRSFSAAWRLGGVRAQSCN